MKFASLVVTKQSPGESITRYCMLIRLFWTCQKAILSVLVLLYLPTRPPPSYSRSSSDVKHFMKDSFQQLIGSNSPFMVYCTWQVKSDLLHLPSSQCVSFLLHHLLSSSPSIFHIYFFSPPPRYSFPPTDCRVCFGSRMQSSKLHAKGERYYDHRTLDDT